MCVCVCEQQALQESQEDLAVTQRILDDAKEKLAAVEEGIATLQAKYHECLAKRDELDAKCQLCENRLIRADKVIGEKLYNFAFISPWLWPVKLTTLSCRPDLHQYEIYD